MSEAQIQSQILEYLKGRKILHWRMPLGAVRRKGGVMAKSPIAGFPDIAGMYKGSFFALEIKAKKGIVSPAQVAWIRDLRDNGAFAAVVRSLDEAIEFLIGIERFVRDPIYAYSRIPIIGKTTND